MRSADAGTMSCEIGSEGLKIMKEGYEIKKAGMISMETGQLLVGNLLSEDLEIGRVLGNGASGYVYEAEHRPTGRKLALKSINIFDRHKRHQLVNDLRSLHKNECPFIVEFLGAIYDEGSVKVALELMDMGSLKSLLAMALKKPDIRVGVEPVVPEAVMSKIMQMSLSGLAYLQVCRKQMHRDIKPDNILANSKGEVKLTDFGIAKQLDETWALAHTFIGTTIYMSPERMEGEQYSYAGDIWSLGVILLEMLLGKYPFPEAVQKDFL